MVTEPFFSVPATVTPMVHGNVVAEPVVDSHVPMAATPIVVLRWQKLMNS
jgi:hypothetical protein